MKTYFHVSSSPSFFSPCVYCQLNGFWFHLFGHSNDIVRSMLYFFFVCCFQCFELWTLRWVWLWMYLHLTDKKTFFCRHEQRERCWNGTHARSRSTDSQEQWNGWTACFWWWSVRIRTLCSIGLHTQKKKKNYNAIEYEDKAEWAKKKFLVTSTPYLFIGDICLDCRISSYSNRDSLTNGTVERSKYIRIVIVVIAQSPNSFRFETAQPIPIAICKTKV